MSGYIHAALHGPALTENRRQLYEDERAALTAFREGRHLEALQGWAGAGHVVATHTSSEGIAAMVSTWLQLSQGAPDPHTRAEGLLMLAATNEQVTRINEAVQAVRAAQEQLGEGRAFALPKGREVRFHVGDQVLYRRNDRHQQAVTGEPVLNGYRGVVTGITAEGVAVAWRQPGDTEAAGLHTGVCSPRYIAEGGLELGYCLTAHKAEGMTVGAQWDRPDGDRNEGSTLIWGPGMDAGGQYVALSRACGASMLFGSLDELEGEREQLLYGQPRDQAELTARVLAALAEQAAATATRSDDRPVMVDLGQAPADPTPAQYERHEQSELDTQPPDGQQRPTIEPASEHEPAVAITDAQQQRWEQLDDRSVRAGLLGDQDAQRAAQDEQDAYAEELGPQLAEALRAAQQARNDAILQRLSTGPEQAPVDVTDAHRQHWRALLDQGNQARRSGDPDAQRAAQDAQLAYRKELGPQRVEILQQELSDRLDRRRAERDTHQGWWARPHSKLTDTELQQAIERAEQKQAEHRAAAEQARAKLAQTEPAVAEGRGPQVTQLDADLAELRHLLELRTLADDVDRRWKSTLTQASMAADHAQQKEIDARRLSRVSRLLRPGLRERLLTEAAELQARSERAQAAAANLERQRAELHQQTGGHGIGHTAQTRSRLQRAEANYDLDLAGARAVDRGELAGLRHQISTHTGSANTTGQRREALTAEHQLRTEMSPTQRTDEHILRTQWSIQQQIQEREARVAEEEQQALARSRDYHYYDRVLQHTDDVSQNYDGFGLGR